MGRVAWLLGTFCASLVFVLALASIGEAKGPDTPITARQAAAAGPGHPWQAALPGVNGLDLHKHTRVPLFAWPTQGGNVESFSLFHNSITLATNDALPPKWTHSGDIFVVTWREGRHAAVHFGSGRIQRFALRGGVYVSLDGYRDRLFWERGQFRLELTDGTLLAFRNVSQEKSVVTRVSDPNGNTTTYRYDRRGRLARIVDPVGRELVLGYSARNRGADDEAPLVQVTFQFDGERRVADLRYGSSGLRTVQLPSFLTPSDPAPQRTTFRFRYDARGNIVRATDTFGNATTFRYRRSGRVTRATTPLGNTIHYVVSGNLRTVTDAAGVATSFAYDALGRLVRLQNANGAEWFRRYTDPRYGFAPSEVEAPLAIIERFTYDPNGNPTSFTDSRGNTWNYAFDTARNLLTRAEAPLVTGNAERARIDFEYDAKRNLTALARSLGGGNHLRTSFAYDSFGNLLSRTNDAGNAWTNQYDTRGNLVESRDPVGRTYRYAYTSADTTLLFTRPDQVTTGEGDLVRIDYDERGRIRSKAFPDATSFTYRYDALGRLAGMTDPTGITSWSFDADGRLIGEAKDSVPPLADHALSFAYTPNNLLARIDVGADRRIDYTYDSVNRLARIADNPSLDFTYNAADQQTGIQRSNGANTVYGYNPGSDLVSRITHVVGAQPPFYDAILAQNEDRTLGRVDEVDGGANAVTRYGYDLIPRPVSEQRSGSNPYAFSWSYDPLTGDRLTETRDGIVRTCSFDSSGRPIACASNVQESYNWNGNNALASRTFGPNRLDYTYSPENHLRQITDGVNPAQFLTDGLGRRVKQDLLSGTTLTSSSQFVNFGFATIREFRTASATIVFDNFVGPNGTYYGISGAGGQSFTHVEQNFNFRFATDATGTPSPAQHLLTSFGDSPSGSPPAGDLVDADTLLAVDGQQERISGLIRYFARIAQDTSQAGLTPVAQPELHLSFNVPPAFSIGSQLFSGGIGPTGIIGTATDTRPNEDRDGDSVLDPGEALNGNGQIDEDRGISSIALDPGSTSGIPDGPTAEELFTRYFVDPADDEAVNLMFLLGGGEASRFQILALSRRTRTSQPA